ncbi:MAG: hypothetical protein IPL78_25990 [Chloroflexi bacterium]|nr:hypothetical protein [Chloroflexota bacterium]
MPPIKPNWKVGAWIPCPGQGVWSCVNHAPEKEWATFLTTYVTQETSLAAANQIANPPLAEMSTLATTLQAADAARKAGSSQRQAAVETRTAAANRLLDLLQAAALILVVTQFNGVVTNNLEQWGFQVVARTPPPNGDSEPIP